MTSDQTLKQAISNITIWRKGEQRAPHKPLLLLHVLSQYRQGHGRLFNYGSEINERLLDLLERYGPQRRDQRPDMPFWRLKGDGFWELQNAELCSTNGSRQPLDVNSSNIMSRVGLILIVLHWWQKIIG